MHTCGVLITKNGQVSRTWSHADPTMPSGIDIPVEPGDRILLCDEIDETVFERLSATLHKWKADDIRALTAGHEILRVPDLPPAGEGQWYCFQPGYRRICVRPHDDALDRQADLALEQSLASRVSSTRVRTAPIMPQPLLRRLPGHEPGGSDDEPVRHGLEFPHHEVVHQF